MGSWIHDGFLDSRWIPGLRRKIVEQIVESCTFVKQIVEQSSNHTNFFAKKGFHDFTSNNSEKHNSAKNKRRSGIELLTVALRLGAGCLEGQFIESSMIAARAPCDVFEP